MEPDQDEDDTDEMAEARVKRDRYAAELAEVRKLPDEIVLERAGGFGPGIIGQALYDHAQVVRVRSADGKLGPGMTGDVPAIDITPWEGWSRAKMLDVARQHKLPDVKAKTERDDLAETLIRNRIFPPKE